MSNQIKLIASDLDRTLLREDKTLSPFTQEVLARCRQRGILFFPVTARPPRSLENWISGLSYDGALCHNGGVALLRGEVIWEQGIAPDMALELLQTLKRECPGATLSAEIGGELYANFDPGVLWKNIPYHLTDFSSLPERPSEKLMVGLESTEQLEVVKALLPDELYAQVSDNTLIMIQPRIVDKGSGLLAACERLGILPEETVGFGDDWNDIPLLTASGIGVAVENALPEVKAVAKEICASNEADGVAHWLEEHLLR